MKLMLKWKHNKATQTKGSITMQQHDLAPTPVLVEDTWNQERSDEVRRSFIDSQLARLATESLGDIDFAVE